MNLIGFFFRYIVNPGLTRTEQCPGFYLIVVYDKLCRDFVQMMHLFLKKNTARLRTKYFVLNSIKVTQLTLNSSIPLKLFFCKDHRTKNDNKNVPSSDKLTKMITKKVPYLCLKEIIATVELFWCEAVCCQHSSRCCGALCSSCRRCLVL